MRTVLSRKVVSNMTSLKNHENDTILEKIENSITGEDEPMGDAHPGAPAALVMGAYPLILIVMLCVAVIYFGYRQLSDDETPTDPNVTTARP